MVLTARSIAEVTPELEWVDIRGSVQTVFPVRACFAETQEESETQEGCAIYHDNYHPLEKVGGFRNVSCVVRFVKLYFRCLPMDVPEFRDRSHCGIDPCVVEGSLRTPPYESDDHHGQAPKEAVASKDLHGRMSLVLAFSGTKTRLH